MKVPFGYNNKFIEIKNLSNFSLQKIIDRDYTDEQLAVMRHFKVSVDDVHKEAYRELEKRNIWAK